MKPVPIQDKAALVTGANRGIGKAITEVLLANKAARVYAAVRDPASAEPLVAEHGSRVVPIEVDLASDDLVTAAAEKADDTFIVVNNAGILRTKTALSDGAIDDLRDEIDVNVYGLIRIARAFAPVLKANGGGAFVQLNSIVSMKCFSDFTTYCASKAAAYSVTQALREQLAEQGTSVVSVHPGPIATRMAEKAGMTEMAEQPSLVGEAIVEALRTGTFHVFPDSMARQIGQAYRSFAETVVESDIGEEAPATA